MITSHLSLPGKPQEKEPADPPAREQRRKAQHAAERDPAVGSREDAQHVPGVLSPDPWRAAQVMLPPEGPGLVIRTSTKCSVLPGYDPPSKDPPSREHTSHVPGPEPLSLSPLHLDLPTHLAGREIVEVHGRESNDRCLVPQANAGRNHQ